MQRPAQTPGSRVPALRIWPEARKLAEKITAASVSSAVRACSQTKVAGFGSLLLVLYSFGQGWFPQSSSSPGLGTGSPWAACEQ